MKGYNIDIGKVLETLAEKSPDANIAGIKERIVALIGIIENLCNDRRSAVDITKSREEFRDECTAQVIALTIVQRAFVEADASGAAAKVAELARDGRFFWTELH